MNVIINNKPAATESITLAELAAELQLPERGVAVAVNNKLVQRTSWAEYTLTEDMQITIVRAACGG